MNSTNSVKVKEILVHLFMMLAGSIICAIGVNVFIRPLHLMSGGVTGIAIVLNYLTDINIGIIVFCVNLPLFVIAYFKLNLEFVLYSLCNMTMFSVILGLTGDLHKVIGIEDNILASCLIGGALNGFGMGLIFRAGGSQGGLDIIAAIIKKKWDFSIGKVLMALNIFIVLWATNYFGSKIFYYTMISMYISYSFVDSVKLLLEKKKVMIIITTKHQNIADELMTNLNRAVTYVDCVGAYKSIEKKLIYTVVSPREIPNIKKIIKKHDTNAFYSISDSLEVKGYRFKERLI
ncbi:MAG: hypothetical protein CSB15_00995 [Clostridiales bacterium]|nr:MAG: hypothetical protein CSB15_00995 [Clostridiales bacterium]